MPLKSSADVGFLIIGGRSVLGRITSLTDSEEMLVEDVTPLGVNSDVWASVGQSKWVLQQNGIYDNAVGAINEALAIDTKQVLMFGLEGNAVGDDFLGAAVVHTAWDRAPSKGALHKANASYMSDEGPDRGKVAAPLVARTTTGPVKTATLDFGVPFANQATGSAIVYLGVSQLTLDGGTGLLVKVFDSADDITYAELIPFTAVVLAPASERKSLAAAVPPNDIERYIQVEWAFTGVPGANKTATFAVGVSRPLA